MLLFRLTLFEGWTFVGDSDRLNTALNVRLFEVDALRTRGSIPAWSEQQFMGSGILALHWILPIFTPVPYLLALLPPTATFHALTVLSAVLLALALGAAYWALGAYSRSPIARGVGALLYGLGAYTIHKLAQLDLAFLALVLPPVLLLLVRETRRETGARTFLGIAACWAALVLFTVLQEIAYVALFFGTYALYRSARLRDPWPMLIAGAAFGCGVAIGLPRVLTVGADFSQASRTTMNIQTFPVEAVRFFGDGLLGRYQGEQRGLLRGTINMHEGVQLLGSALGALATLAVGLLARSWVVRLWAVALAVVLSVALAAFAPTFYSFGFDRAAFPSREIRAFVANAVLFGLPLWLASRWLARRAFGGAAVMAAASSGGTPASSGGTPASSTAVPSATSANELTPAAVADAPFFIGFVALALAAILIPEARTVLYYGFLKVDFLHSRISVAMTLPLAALATIFLDRFLSPRGERKAARWLVGGLVLGLGLWLVREAAAEAAVARFGEILETRPRLVRLEAIRVVTSLLVLLAAVVLLVGRTRPTALTLTGGVLAAWIAGEALVSADVKLSGPHTREQAVPFVSLNYMNAPPGALRPPTQAQRAAVRERLDVDAYRTILIQDRKEFPALVEPHVAAMWDLRLVEGYSTGLPRRLGALPWDESMGDRHHLDIQTFHALPWRLLAALNVKYAVAVDRSLWYNPAPGGADPPLDPAGLRVMENPYPVSPRAFFAARVSPAGSEARFPGDDGVRPPPADPFVDDPAAHSVAEGLPDERAYPTAGTLAATFDGDRVAVRVDPSPEPRFLVLNEMYHPAWRATIDGRPAEIYPTNLVMRGLVVPADATTIELRYTPFLASPAGLGMVAAGIVATLLGWLALRRWATRPDGPARSNRAGRAAMLY